MYKTDYGIVYETLDELLTQNIAVIYEYGGFLYVKLKPTEEYTKYKKTYGQNK